MLSAMKMAEAIRSKRKKLKADGVENMIDTAPGPQMNPQDIHNQKMNAQVEATLDSHEKSSAESDPACADVSDTSQKTSYLKKKHARLQKIFNSL